MTKFQNPTIKKILEKYEIVSALEQALYLAGWDLETYMPESGAANRGFVMGKLATLMQKYYLEKEFIKLVEEASNQSGLNDYEKGIVRVLQRSLYYYFNVPAEFIEEFSSVTSEAQVAWRDAKSKNDYSIFEPYLAKIIDLNIRQANYLKYEENPYDALLDIYEEDLTTKDVEEFFDSIRPTLKDLLAYIKRSKKYSARLHELTKEAYDKERLEDTNYKILELFNYNPKELRLDISSHPFTQSINNKDVRITTRYLGNDFAATTSSTIHEYGHALYELGISDSIAKSPIGKASSLIIHESQSRFWENIIGRNAEFVRLFLSKYKKLGDEFKNYSFKDFYNYFNTVRPGFIRVEADEVTYHYHIMIRFELEKMMINKEVTAKELPELWNQKYKDYLGIKPRSYREGILQDIHWSGGSIGYFPTYSMGTILSSQWTARMEKEIGSVDKLIVNSKGIAKIQKWLTENIHQYGSTYTMKELLRKSLKEDYSAEYWKKYITKKYKSIY